MKYSKELHDGLRDDINRWTKFGEFPENGGVFGALLDEIERLQEERRWIPVKTNTIHQSNVIREVITEEKKIYLAFLCTEGWVDHYRNVIIDNVTHYMPLPPAPESEDK